MIDMFDARVKRFVKLRDTKPKESRTVILYVLSFSCFDLLCQSLLALGIFAPWLKRCHHQDTELLLLAVTGSLQQVIYISWIFKPNRGHEVVTWDAPPSEDSESHSDQLDTLERRQQHYPGMKPINAARVAVTRLAPLVTAKKMRQTNTVWPSGSHWQKWCIDGA